MTSANHKIAPTPAPAANDRPLATLVFNIALPAFILSKLSAETRLGPLWALVVALCFPLVFGIHELVRRRRANYISVLGFLSIAATGSIGLFHLDGGWFAIKEATIPSLMGIAIVGSLWTKSPLVRVMLYNDKVIDVHKIDAELAARGHTESFAKRLVHATWILAAAFFLSAAANFTLATILVKSPAGSVAFNQELGHMTAVSYPVIVVPCMIMTLGALWWLVHGIKRMTGLDMDAIFKNPPAKTSSAAPKPEASTDT